MSIRLKLTVLYSGILALTLFLFGSALYATFAKTSLNEIENKLDSAAHFIPMIEHSTFLAYFTKLPNRFPADERFTSQLFWSIRTLNGTIVATDPNLNEHSLPISDTDLSELVRTQHAQRYIDMVEGERFIIQSQIVNVPGKEPMIIQVGMSLAERDRYLWRLGRMLVVGTTMTLLLAFGMGWFLSGYTLKPINELTRTAQSIGAAQDFSQRVDYSGPADEIGQLATTFNDMLSQLEASYRQMSQSLESQRRFVADASHELRTPLTTIRGNLGLLQREPPIPRADQADVLDDMVSETERLMRLVSGLLVLARADTRQTMTLSPFALTPLLNEVCRQFQTLTNGRPLQCDVDADLTILGNRDALKQVLLALMDNAVKHTSVGTTIILKTQATDESVIITLADTGAGIDSRDLPHIFDRFYRGDAARTGDSAGLGLAIAKELVEAQKGHIEVDSLMGQGTSFHLQFPRQI